MTDNLQPQEPTPEQEPSVLDYLKSLFRFGRGERIQLPEFVEEEQPSVAPFPWRSMVALLFALLGQKLFEPPPITIPLGIAFYIVALAMLGWSIYRGDWTLAPLTEASDGTDPLTYRRLALILSLLLALPAFILFSGNLFTTTNFFLWIVAIILFIFAFWIGQKNRSSMFGDLTGGITIKITPWALLLVAATVSSS